MKSIEPTITMLLSEFNKLKNEHETMKKILCERKNDVAFEFKSDYVGMGFIRNSFNIITKDELITKLVDYIKELQSESVGVYQKLYEERNKQSEKEKQKRSWF